jgi:hypothetical protein
MVRVLVFVVAASVAFPFAAIARDSSEPSDTPEASASVRPSESPRGDRGEVRSSTDVSESPEPSETPEIDVPQELQKSSEKLASESADIRTIHVDKENKSVEVSYRLRARLFGIIPIPYDLQAKVDTKNKTVEAHGPWWLIFASDNLSAVQASLSADQTLTTQTNQGQILSRIISILKALAPH